MNSTAFICKYEDCNLIYENPVTVPCGNSLCQQHLDEFDEKFNCPFCFDVHQKPSTSSLAMIKMIDSHFELDPLRKMAKESFNKLNTIIEEYKTIEPEVYVYDYFADIRNKVELHREEVKKEIDDKSDEIIQQLKEKEEECKLNAQKLEKINLDELIKDTLPSLKQKFRAPIIDLEELNDLLSQMYLNIEKIEYYIKKFKLDLLISQSIDFEKYEESSLLGQLIIKSDRLLLSRPCELITNYKSHKCNISSIQLNEKSTEIISSSLDRTIKIWNSKNGECLKTLEDHQDCVTNILIIPNNKFITGSIDKTVKVWDLNSYQCLKTLVCESHVDSFCLISKNQIACGCRNGLIDIWNLEKFSKIHSFKAHRDSITFLLANKTKLISCSFDYKIKIYNLNTLKFIRKMKHCDIVNYLDFTTDGNLISCSDDQTVKIWQIETGILLKSIEFEHSVYCVRTLNKDLTAIGLSNGEIQIYNLSKNEKMKSISAHTSYVNCLYLTQNDNLLSGSGDGEIKLWKIFE